MVYSGSRYTPTTVDEGCSEIQAACRLPANKNSDVKKTFIVHDDDDGVLTAKSFRRR
jgi:hypothetical protein